MPRPDFWQIPRDIVLNGHFHVQTPFSAKPQISLQLTPSWFALFLWVGTSVDEDFDFHQNLSRQAFVCLADFLKTEMMKGVYMTEKQIS